MPDRQPDVDVRRWSAYGILAGVVPYLVVLADFGWQPFRRAYPIGTYSNFFDIQARAIMHGHLSVPPGSLGIEEFVVRGHSYMYFPPFPALLRIPVLALGHGLDGKLTAPSMLLGWVVFAVAVAALVWTVRFRLRSDPVTTTEALVGAVLIAVITGGSSMLYIASLPYTFHEVYVWSAAWSTAGIVALLRACSRPSLGRVAATGLFTTLTVLTRTPAGWALALTVVAIAARMWLSRTEPSRRASARVAAAGIAPIVVGAAVNWAKFRHPYRFPIGAQVWSMINPDRQAALAANRGRLDGIQFIDSTVLTYFRPDGIRFVPYLPWVTFPAERPTAVGHVVLDQTFRTGSITAFMPLLVGATIVGMVVAFRRGAGPRFSPIRIVLVGTLAMAGPVLAFSYISYRYTAEFLPLLSVGSAVGFASLGGWWRSGRRRTGRLVAIGIVATYGVLANLAAAVGESRVTAGGEALHEWMEARLAIGSWSGTAGDVLRVEHLPPSGAADQIAVVGDCDGMYLGTAQPVESWTPVEIRDVIVAVESDGSRGAAELELAAFRGVRTRRLLVERDDDGRLRLVVRSDDYLYLGDWFRSGREPIRVEIVHDLDLRAIFVRTNVGFTAVEYASDRDEHGTPVTVETDVLGGADRATRDGLSATRSRGPTPELCGALLDE